MIDFIRAIKDIVLIMAGAIIIVMISEEVREKWITRLADGMKKYNE